MLLSIEKIFKNILVKYLDFTKVFSKNLAKKPLNCLNNNKYSIDLEKEK